ncbi:MAG: branched-chain-amino-acid transaminase [Thaumarchaeota archaeon]|nr:branched-chain-amino-acid transaminase [Nitrososphaerota archaeon]
MKDAEFCWMDGKVLRTEEALCSALSPMHLGVFEGIRAYVQGDILSRGKLAAFRWHDHINRLWRSARVMGIEIPFSKEELFRGLRDSLAANGYDSNTYISPRVFPRNYISSGLTEKEVRVIMRVIPEETLLDVGNSRFEGKFRINVSSWRRISSDSLPPQNKSFANYANSRLAELESQRLGFDDCLFLDSRGLVAEGGGSCILGIKDGTLVTPPVSASVLKSITRDSILRIAREDLVLKVEERDLSRIELYEMDEVFMCGTWAEVRPVKSIDDLEFGKEYPGPVTRKIANYFASAVTGKEPKRASWLTPL